MRSLKKFSLVAHAATLGNFFNLHKYKKSTARYVNICYTRVLKPLVVMSSVISRVRVVWFMESICNVSFLFQGQGYAMKVNEFQMWRHDRRHRWPLIKTSCYQDFSECSKRGNTIDVSTSVSSIKN